MAATMLESVAPFDSQDVEGLLCEVLHHFFEADEINDAGWQKAQFGGQSDLSESLSTPPGQVTRRLMSC